MALICRLHNFVKFIFIDIGKIAHKIGRIMWLGLNIIITSNRDSVNDCVGLIEFQNRGHNKGSFRTKPNCLRNIIWLDAVKVYH